MCILNGMAGRGGRGAAALLQVRNAVVSLVNRVQSTPL